MNASVTVVYYKSKTLSNGEHPLMIRITQNRRTKYKSLGVSVRSEYWDFQRNQPKRNCPNRDVIISLIAEKIRCYQNKLMEFKTEDKEFTLTTLVDKLTKQVKRKTVSDLFIEQIDSLKALKRIGYSLSVQQVYNSLIKYNKHLDIYFSDIDTIWLKKYEEWLRGCGLAENTIGIRFRTLRAIYNLAIEQKIVKSENYPFKSYKVSKLHHITAKRALVKENLSAIINYDTANKDKYTKLAIDLFTFSYYMGGINFVDIAHLTNEHIVDNRLVYTRIKTHKIIKLPIQSKAFELIKKYQSSDNPYIFPIFSLTHKTEQQKRNRVHKVITKVNQHLKDIGVELNLPLLLTTYVARHTFVTSVTLANGVSIESVAKMLGHSNTKMTHHYARVLDKTILSEMDGVSSKFTQKVI